MNAAFFDTPIIACAADVMASDPSRRTVARRLMQTRTIVTSTQVMLELYDVMRRKLSYAPEAALAWVSALRDDESRIAARLRTRWRVTIS